MTKKLEDIPPAIDPNDKWWEEPPQAPKPYQYGEIYDPEDETRDYFLCPECGLRKKGSPDVLSRPGTAILKCPANHIWLLDAKTRKIEGPNRTLDFGEK